MNETFTKIKDFIARYWFLASSLGLAILYALVRQRDSTIASLHLEIQRTKLGEQLKSINEVEAKDNEAYQKSRAAYLALKRQHPEHFSD